VGAIDADASSAAEHPERVPSGIRESILPLIGERPRGADLLAGLSVVFILVPQSLAYAELAGLPPYVGLYAAALPPLAAAFFASSRYLQTGPVAMTSLLTFGALTPLATPFTNEYWKLAILLALIVGVVRVVLGLVRLGVLAYFMSQPVLLGFTSAAALLIIAGQLPTAFGVDAPRGSVIERAGWALTHPGSWELTAVVLSLVTVALVMSGRRFHPLFPGVVVAVIGGIAYSSITGYGGAVVGEVPTGFPPFSLALPWSAVSSLLVPGIVIAVVGFAEANAIGRLYAARDRERWSPDRELLSQGVANLASGISGGFPVGGSFARSSVNRLSGGRTRWSGAISGLAVLAFLPFASVLESLPRAILAAIVIAAVARLFRIDAMVRLVGESWGQSFVAWVTFAATLLLAPRVDLGVLLGVGVAIVVHLRRELRIRVEATYHERTLTLHPMGVLFYGSAPRLHETLLAELAANPEADELVVNLARLGRIDYTGAQALETFVAEAEAAGLRVSVVGVPAHARGILDRVWPEMPTGA
jgi:SulP family sulfate permease